ncbi:MAG TPA: hypothetical protein VLX12_03350, partial [Syntrophorhabdales bacterium]|nr:hypothetical protein [Syntrophorhabdales bacterium]
EHIGFKHFTKLFDCFSHDSSLNHALPSHACIMGRIVNVRQSYYIIERWMMSRKKARLRKQTD